MEFDSLISHETEDITIIIKSLMMMKQKIEQLKPKDSVFYVYQTLFFVFLVCEALFISQAFAILWITKILLLFAVYNLEGAKPYYMLYLLPIIADLLHLWWLQIASIILLAYFLIKFRFFKIPLIEKGNYEVGFKCVRKEGQELAVFYPTTEEGEAAFWVQTKDYHKNLYDLAFINPLKKRWVPAFLFRMLISYMNKVKMPVRANTKLQVVSPEKNTASVIIFSHGLSLNMTSNSAYCAWLASQGHIVISVQHNGDLVRFPYDEQLFHRKQLLAKLMFINKNEDLQLRAQQVKEVYSELITGALLPRIFCQNADLGVEEVHLCGYSFGGATCLETVAHMEQRGDVSLDLLSDIICIDPWVYPLSESTLNHHFGKKISIINSETFFDRLPIEFKMRQKLARIKKNNKANFSGYVVMGSDHAFAIDFPFVCGNGVTIITKCLNFTQSRIFLSMLQTVTFLTLQKENQSCILEKCQQKYDDQRLKLKKISVQKEQRCQSALYL